ncbi:CIA30 family protein [Carboxylicivirga taeanensis]|uniref:CIA30 family protein n=1 Tax=Carboxylicivirga taeanensis TaxID=1416875 RepID=UPI003F6E0F09
MKWMLIIMLSMGLSGKQVIIDFTKESDLIGWQVINDGVMGGVSEGDLFVNKEGHGVFHGFVSTANNGGFSMVRFQFNPVEVKTATVALLRIKGDGKRYQFRVKSSRNDRHSYVQFFQTNGEWQEVEIELGEMRPSFRGQALKMPNYPGNVMEEVAFLIGNKKAEPFRLEIDYIHLK